MTVACQVIQVNPETDHWPECGKDAVGYSADGVAVCAGCEDDDTLQIVTRIGEPPCHCAETSTRNCPRHQNGDEG